uniref:PI4-kinase N-terminal domain-containing protein n=1 Tax=Lactuca sativa TaxID=4236 RepID=A0A9R1WVW4_LACSA|nr:hypothetical protein LSAT_V11C800415840 [Lactuca sativa]
METGIFIWTWLVSVAPQHGYGQSIPSEVYLPLTRAAKLRPHLQPNELESPPEKDPVEQILAHKLWIGFSIDHFEVVRHDSLVQLLLFGRMLPGTPNFHGNFHTIQLLLSCYLDLNSAHASMKGAYKKLDWEFSCWKMGFIGITFNSSFFII